MSKPVTMLGYPVHFSDRIPTLGNTGDIKLELPWTAGEHTCPACGGMAGNGEMVVVGGIGGRMGPLCERCERIRKES